jgi:WXG100 family type VII secretion target
MTRFAVDLDELSAVIGDMRSFESRFQSRLAELDDLVARLHGTWTGEAAAAQQAAHDEWKAGATEMHQALVEMRDAARRAHGNYTSAAEANRAMWSQTR